MVIRQCWGWRSAPISTAVLACHPCPQALCRVRQQPMPFGKAAGARSSAPRGALLRYASPHRTRKMDALVRLYEITHQQQTDSLSRLEHFSKPLSPCACRRAAQAAARGRRAVRRAARARRHPDSWGPPGARPRRPSPLRRGPPPWLQARRRRRRPPPAAAAVPGAQTCVMWEPCARGQASHIGKICIMRLLSTAQRSLITGACT